MNLNQFNVLIQTTMDEVEIIENIIIVAIIILLIVFIGSLIILIIICCNQRCNQYYNLKNSLKSKKSSFIFSGSDNNHSNHHNNKDDFGYFDHTHLISNSMNFLNGNNNMINVKRIGDGVSGNNHPNNISTITNLELDDVRLHPNIDTILSNTQWVDDATGLIPHCLSLLKGCHHLTERLVATTMTAMSRFSEYEQKQKLFEINIVASTICQRVDDIIEAMYPPLDSRLLESRCLSLLLSVSRLAIVIIYTCSIQSKWIDDELKGLELQLKILREVGQNLLVNNPNNPNDVHLKQPPSSPPTTPVSAATATDN